MRAKAQGRKARHRHGVSSSDPLHLILIFLGILFFSFFHFLNCLHLRILPEPSQSVAARLDAVQPLRRGQHGAAGRSGGICAGRGRERRRGVAGQRDALAGATQRT